MIIYIRFSLLKRSLIELLLNSLCIIGVDYYTFGHISVFEHWFDLIVFLLIPSLLSWILYKSIDYIVTQRIKKRLKALFLLVIPLSYLAFNFTLFILGLFLGGIPD